MTTSTWQVTGLHHVAIAHDAESVCVETLSSLVGPAGHSENGPGFLERMFGVGPSFVQTLEAQGDGVVQRFLDKRGPGLHHLALEVNAIDAALVDLVGRGVPLIDREARSGGMGTRIAFLHPSAFGGVLVELVERAPSVHGDTLDEGEG